VRNPRNDRLCFRTDDRAKPRADHRTFRSAGTIRIHGTKPCLAKAAASGRRNAGKRSACQRSLSLARYPRAIGRGQRHGGSSAMAIALRPVAFDCGFEPTTALDVTTQAQILTC